MYNERKFIVATKTMWRLTSSGLCAPIGGNTAGGTQAFSEPAVVDNRSTIRSTLRVRPPLPAIFLSQMRGAPVAVPDQDAEVVRRDFEAAVRRVSGWKGPAVTAQDVRENTYKCCQSLFLLIFSVHLIFAPCVAESHHAAAVGWYGRDGACCLLWLEAAICDPDLLRGCRSLSLLPDRSTCKVKIRELFFEECYVCAMRDGSMIHDLPPSSEEPPAVPNP